MRVLGLVAVLLLGGCGLLLDLGAPDPAPANDAGIDTPAIDVAGRDRRGDPRIDSRSDAVEQDVSRPMDVGTPIGDGISVDGTVADAPGDGRLLDVVSPDGGSADTILVDGRADGDHPCSLSTTPCGPTDCCLRSEACLMPHGACYRDCRGGCECRVNTDCSVPPWSLCRDRVCVDPSSHPLYCGSLGSVCDSGDRCLDGGCPR